MRMVKKCDDGQCKDVMVASLVVSVAQLYGRSDDGQCDHHVGQFDMIGQWPGRCDDDNGQ